MRLLSLIPLLLTLLGPSPAVASDGVFTVSTLSKARTEAGTERMVVVYLDEPDNADCAFMSTAAWTHPDVRAWVTEHGVAAKVDGFSFHGASLRGKYQVKQLPAVLAFRGADLTRRHQGVLDGPELAAWLEVARIGDIATADDMVNAQKDAKADLTVDIDARLVAALSSDSPEQAADVLLSLWRSTQGGPLQDDRRTRVAQALRPHLIHETAQRMTAQERDAAWSRHRRKKTLPDLLDWIALNTLLGEDSETLTWVKSAMADKKGIAWVRQVIDQPDDPLLPMLSGNGQWRAIGDGVANPMESIDRRRSWYAENRTTITGVTSQADQDALRHYQGAIVSGLLAAQRDREAKEVAEYVASLDRDAGPAVVQVALEANQPRRWMRKLLNPSKADQVQLAMALTKALQGI